LSGVFYALAAVVAVSLTSLIGLLALSAREEFLDRILFFLVSFASGAILGAAYFDLIPEAIEAVKVESAIACVALGFAFFYLLERSVYWYHGHGHMHVGEGVKVSWEDERVRVKSFVYLNLIGDGVHNLIDGMVIGASFLISLSAGLVATLAVAFHELPQEIGDFAILIYGGLSRLRALTVNFLTALTAVLGVVIIYLGSPSPRFLGLLVGFVGGGFIYISAAELIPELQKERGLARSIFQFLVFIAGCLGLGKLVGLNRLERANLSYFTVPFLLQL